MVTLLKSHDERAKLMRRDTAEILTRLFFAECSLVIAQAGWIPSVATIEAKSLLARTLWEDSVAATNMRERILELRYPRRDVNPTLHTAIVAVFDEARNAPNAEAFMMGLARVLKPAMRKAYLSFYQQSDRVSDGPSAMILRHALEDLNIQIAELEDCLAQMLSVNDEAQHTAKAWTMALQEAVDALGETLLEATTEPSEPVQLVWRKTYELPQVPARDSRFQQVRFYWPHLVDPNYSSSEGLALQLRSAIGHLNEVWATEAAAVALYQFGETLEWEYVADTSRWTYDESRHCLMGYHRLLEWGFTPEELPLGDYSYRIVVQNEPIYAIGLLHYYETKFIHRGQERIATFAEYQDTASLHDYEFDWADETFHAEYGRRWLNHLFTTRTQFPRDIEEMRQASDTAVNTMLATVTPEEEAQIKAIANHLFEKAQTLVEPIVQP